MFKETVKLLERERDLEKESTKITCDKVLVIGTNRYLVVCAIHLKGLIEVVFFVPLFADYINLCMYFYIRDNRVCGMV